MTPTWDEPFGLVVAEALACGTPVAAFDSGAIAELVDDDTGVLAPAGDVDALSAAMLRAATLDRSTCRGRAEARFSSAVMTDAYEEWFQDCCARRDGMTPSSTTRRDIRTSVTSAPAGPGEARSVWDVDGLAAVGRVRRAPPLRVRAPDRRGPGRLGAPAAPASASALVLHRARPRQPAPGRPGPVHQQLLRLLVAASRRRDRR